MSDIRGTAQAAAITSTIVGPEPILMMPRRPTWQRYLNIFIRDRKLSMLRALEYEALGEVSYNGRILDFGGGANSHYLSVLGQRFDIANYESVNISAVMKPTYLVRPGEPIPLKDSSYDMVMAVNTLEHVMQIEQTIEQLVCLLRPGGRVVFCTPFLFRGHGSPQDYNRPTATWWMEVLQRNGMRDISVDPLVWDAFSTGQGVSELAGPFKLLRRLLVPLYGLIYARIRTSSGSSRYPTSVGIHMANYALGFVVQATRT